MKNSIKKFYATLLTVILILACSVPFFANAQQGTLGTENPKLTATFIDTNGQEVDGNNLTAGSYTVKINLSGMQAVSIFQLTASFTQDITIKSASTIGGTFSCGALIYDKSPFVAILASKNADTTPIQKDGTVMITMNVTVANAGDFANFFKVSTDPDLTFVEADYRDGTTDAYVCSENTTAKYPNLTYDMSPDLAPTTFDVKGQIAISKDVTGDAHSGGIVGITVAVEGTDVSAVTDSNGNYTLPALKEGTYTLTISGDTTVDRTVTLIVSADKAVAGEINVELVPVVVCDYNHDGRINTTDVAIFGTRFSESDVYTDLNCDAKFNTTDVAMFGSFVGQTIQYSSVTL